MSDQNEKTVDDDWPPAPLRRLRLQVNQEGEVVVPAEFVRALGLHQYDVLLAWVEGEELRLETLASGLRKAEHYFRSRVTTGYLSDELIADRRVEALREVWE